MKPKRKSSATRPSMDGWSGLFFLAMFLYLWLKVNPSWEYFYSANPFFLDRDFIRPFLAYPGGIIKLLYRLISQANHASWLGALVFTGICSLIFWITGILGRQCHATLSSWIRYPPLFILVVFFNWQPYIVFHTALGFLAGLATALAYVCLPFTGRIWRLTTFFLAAAGLYSIAGLGPLLIFVLFSSLSQLIRFSSWRLALLQCFLGVIIWRTMDLAFDFEWQQSILQLDESKVRVLLLFSLGYYPVAVWVSWYANSQYREPASPTRDHRRLSYATRIVLSFRQLRYRWWLRGIGLLAGIIAVGSTLDTKRQEIMAIDYLASKRDWNRIPPLAEKVRGWTDASQVNIRLALFHSGRLLEDLFRVPQDQAFQLIPLQEKGQDIWRALSRTLLDLGQINQAEHYTFEALELYGDYPELLQTLAHINVLKGHPRAARVFLNRLKKHPLFQAQATQQLHELDKDPTLSQDPLIAAIRPVMVKTDYATSLIPTVVMLKQALHSNPRNKMAFEYLIAHHLLTRKLDALVKELKSFENFGYREFPRAVQEALVIYQERNPGQPLDLGKYAIRNDILHRFVEFNEIINRFYPDLEAALRNTKTDFCDTFWFYDLFGRSLSRIHP